MFKRIYSGKKKLNGNYWQITLRDFELHYAEFGGKIEQ